MNTEDTNKILNWISEEKDKLKSLENIAKSTTDVRHICKNCKFWDPEFNSYGEGECKKIVHCHYSKIGSKATIYSGELNCTLITEDSFGCLSFENKY